MSLLSHQRSSFIHMFTSCLLLADSHFFSVPYPLLFSHINRSLIWMCLLLLTLSLYWHTFTFTCRSCFFSFLIFWRQTNKFFASFLWLATFLLVEHKLFELTFTQLLISERKSRGYGTEKKWESASSKQEVNIWMNDERWCHSVTASNCDSYMINKESCKWDIFNVFIIGRSSSII